MEEILVCASFCTNRFTVCSYPCHISMLCSYKNNGVVHRPSPSQIGHLLVQYKWHILKLQSWRLHTPAWQIIRDADLMWFAMLGRKSKHLKRRRSVRQALKMWLQIAHSILFGYCWHRCTKKHEPEPTVQHESRPQAALLKCISCLGSRAHSIGKCTATVKW